MATATRTRKPAHNWTLIAATVIVYGYLLSTLALSVSNIIGFAGALGASGMLAHAAPLFVDGLFLMGKLLSNPRLGEDCNRYGFKLMCVGGALSLIANVFHGHTAGDRVVGALLVLGFVLVEHGATLLGRVSAARREARNAPDPIRAEAARKAAATRKANAERARRDERKAAREMKIAVERGALVGTAE